MRGALTILACCALAVPAGLAGGARAQAPTGDRDCLRSLRGIDLQRATIPDLQAAMARGELTSAGLVEAYLARIEAFDRSGSKLNAIRDVNPTARAQAARLDAERAAGRIAGPLHGIPVLLKDNIGTTDQPTTAGSIALEGSIPRREAFVTERLRAAGAVILGKTNLSEFANWVALGMPNGYSSLGGQVHGAYDGGDPSGSSSGSGVAGATALAAATIGTETSGSILSPSQVGSLVGVKPTVGLVSRAGIIPLSPSFDTAGPMVRSVTDAALVLGAVAGPDPRDPVTAGAQVADYAAALRPDALRGVRLAYSQDDRDGLSSARSALYESALAKLEELGATLVPVRSLDLTTNVGLTEIAAIPNEFKASLNAYLAGEAPPDIRVKTLTEIIEFNRQHPDKVKYGQNLLEISDLTPGNATLGTAQSSVTIASARASIDAALAEGDADAIVVPGTLRVNQGAAAGYPTVQVPMGYANGTAPAGLSFMGTAYSEASLLAYAYAYEQVTDLRRPPTLTQFENGARPGSCDAASRPPFVAPAKAEGEKTAKPKKAKSKKAKRCRKRFKSKRKIRRCRRAAARRRG